MACLAYSTSSMSAQLEGDQASTPWLMSMKVSRPWLQVQKKPTLLLRSSLGFCPRRVSRRTRSAALCNQRPTQWDTIQKAFCSVLPCVKQWQESRLQLRKAQGSTHLADAVIPSMETSFASSNQPNRSQVAVQPPAWRATVCSHLRHKSARPR